MISFVVREHTLDALNIKVYQIIVICFYYDINASHFKICH